MSLVSHWHRGGDFVFHTGDREFEYSYLFFKIILFF